MKQKKDLMFIGEVAKQLDIHEQTIRTYERKNLVKPRRNENNIRVFGKKEITRIATILTLTQEIGLNIAGVRAILAMAKNFKMNDDELLDFILDHSDQFKN